MPTTILPGDPLPTITGLELQESIGEGGMSTVYRALHLALQRTVAVKILKVSADGSEANATWLRESRVMASLTHPHVVTVHDAGQVSGHYYLVMEYMPGGSLRSRMEPGRPWALDDAFLVLDSVAEALQYIHKQGVLHLDLKPENILYAADGRIKIADFGLAVPRGDAAALGEGHRSLGTPDYAAPEQRTGAAADGSFDVFSLATLAYELLTGRLPGRVYVPASQRNILLPDAFDEVLRRGLERDPEQRYSSMEEFRRAFASAYASTKLRGRIWPAALAGLVALSAVIGVAYKAFVPPSEPVLISAEQDVVPRLARLWVVPDPPDDLPAIDREYGDRLSQRSDVRVDWLNAADSAARIPPELPLTSWPASRPFLVTRSQNEWGFVFPLQDRRLGRRVADNWPSLVRTQVPAHKNLVVAGGFDGECLVKNHQGKQWRAGRTEDWTDLREIAIDRSSVPGNPSLLLKNLDPGLSPTLLGCYQVLSATPPPGRVLLLRYRAKSLRKQGSLGIHFSLPVALAEDDQSRLATRIRASSVRLPAAPNEPGPGRRQYRKVVWLTPDTHWQTYHMIVEAPPQPTRSLHRNLVIDVSGTDQFWVDDVELFEWRPEIAP